MALILASGLTTGCQRPLQPVFQAPATPWVCPPPPAQTRIRYVGELRSNADLKRRPGAFEALGNLIVGRKKPEPLYGPRALAASPDGRFLCIADPGGRCLHFMDLATRRYTKVTRAGSTPLLTPVDVTPGPGNSVLVCDSEASAVYRFSIRTGEFEGLLRTAEDVRRPAAAYYDPGADEIYVVDVVAHDVKVFTPAGALRRIIGSRGVGPGQFNFPCDITGDATSIWIVDAGNHRIQRLAPDGTPRTIFGQAGDAMGNLALPKGVALDSDGHVYVVDARFENVQIFDAQGQLLLVFGEEGRGIGEFWLPSGIDIDQQDRIYIADTYNGRIQVFEYLGESK